jgi:hypothetical protein
MSRGERFLAAFNEIESHFRRTLQADTHVEFSALAKAYAERKRLPRPQREALSAFVLLRNAISHGRYYAGKPIAEPVDGVVDQIEHLRDQIMAPPKALDVLTRREVCTVHPDNEVGVALQRVLQFGYSQLPVYEGDKYMALLTTNAIARWLGGQLTQNGNLAESQPVRHVLEFAETYEHAVHVARSTTAAEAVHRLSFAREGGRPPAALIITETGRTIEKPLGVVVIDDLPVITAALSFG